MRVPRLSQGKRGAVVALVFAAFVVGGAATTSAGTLRVCPSGCDYATISDALAAAKSGEKITIAAGGYSGDLTIGKNVSLLGAGADQVTISGGSPVISVSPGATVTISGVTITGGTNRRHGGGLFNGGKLTLTASTVSGNGGCLCGGDGGGIDNEGTLTVDASTVSGNGGDGGGGIFNNFGSVTLNDTTVSGNGSAGTGGGIFTRGTMLLSGSTVSGNNAGSDGGGIANESGSLVLKKSTISGNSAAGNGGGIRNYAGTVTLKQSSVSGNIPDDCVGC
jgi:predicted outer membrane repeat protein